jgi:hypothetical protein
MNAIPATMMQAAVTKPAILPAGDISARIGLIVPCEGRNAVQGQGWFLPTTLRE